MSLAFLDASRDLEGRVVEALTRHRHAGSVVLRFPAPRLSLAPALAALESLASDDVGARDRLVWAPENGPAFAGLGIAARAEFEAAADWPVVLESLRFRTGALFSDLSLLDFSSGKGTLVADSRGLRLFGAVPFSTRSLEDRSDGSLSAWGSLGRGGFVLPRWLYCRSESGPGSSLDLVVDPKHNDTRDLVARVVRALDALDASDATEKPSDEAIASSTATPSCVDTGIDDPEYRELVEEILASIADGSFEKVVAARSTTLELERPLDLERVLLRLGEHESTCARFVIERDGRLFFGATPERLVTKRGLEVETQALAGSIDPDTSRGGSAARLLESDKDLREHALVVDHLVARLRSLASHIEPVGEPVVRRLESVLHLETPVHVRLAHPVHILELLGRLHPTPAVGGVPARPAVQFLDDHERGDRGLYAGAVGWFNLSGDGDFRVSLRSGLVAHNQVRVWAGAGIVAGSDPVAELRETEVKARAVKNALEGAIVQLPEATEERPAETATSGAHDNLRARLGGVEAPGNSP